MQSRYVLALCALVLMGCAATQPDRRAFRWDFTGKCDPAEFGHAWCESKARKGRLEL